MPLNPQQKAIVEALEGGVNVVAGAGTGKTFTLTERIVAAVERSIELDGEGSDPTSRVLAITFTNKAAGELKSRVRQAFLDAASRGGANSVRYLECALNIDNAWVSTIHGMASRILRENAIEFGIDPSFQTLSPQAESRIFSQAVALALDEVDGAGDPALRGFVHAREIEGPARASHTVSSMTEALFSATGYMPGGLDGVVVRDRVQAPREAVEGFARQASAVRRLFELDGWPAGEASKLSGLAQAIDEASETLARALDASEASGKASRAGAGDVLAALLRFPATTDKFGKKSDHYEDMLRYRLEYKLAAERLVAFETSSKARCLLRFARIVKRHMDDIKGKGRTKFTESDLLAVCNERLSDPASGPVLERYREQFRFIMLDEFQDTDPLQMSIISKMAAPPDEAAGVPPLSNVCTVGDMQQSIYRFRGGDVEETQKRMASLKDGCGRQFRLSGNYRSHADVLSAVEAVFSQERAFGGEFLKLDAARDEESAPRLEVFDREPRVEFDFVHGRRSFARNGKTEPGVSSGDARAVAAANVARHFRKLADAGASPSGMAVLLGRMTHADVFADALRGHGFECAITGGSVFAETMPARLVEALLSYAVNQQDEPALLFLLTSPMFQVSDDVLLSLVREACEDGARPRGLARAFSAPEPPVGLGEGDLVALESARRVLSAFVAGARRGKASSALRAAFVDSGMLGRLELSQGAASLADAGNIAKAVHVVEGFESASCGIAEVASRYSAHLATAKEAPGTLATSGSEYVQIMTVHASKGLEFDHVALAEMRDGTPPSRRPPFVIENVDGRTYLSFRPEKDDFASPDDYDAYKRLRAFSFADLGLDVFGYPLEDGLGAGGSKRDAFELRKRRIADAQEPGPAGRLLEAHQDSQELEEARRLMYVAMTRARESLFVSHCCTTKPSSGYKGVFDDVYEALLGHFAPVGGEFDDDCRMVGTPVGMTRRVLESPEAVEEALRAGLADGEGGPAKARAGGPREECVDVPVYEPRSKRRTRSYVHSRRGVYSYTSLAKGLPASDPQADDFLHEGFVLPDWQPSVMGDGLSAEAAPAGPPLEGAPEQGSAVDLGTAFHRLCQISILKAREAGARRLEVPGEEAVDAQTRLCGLTSQQAARLRSALALWFGSDLARDFAAHENIAAEVPFAVLVVDDEASAHAFEGAEAHASEEEGPKREEGRRIVLEGEIDALADDGDGRAFLVDYKTGSSHGASEEALRAKHLFQSQCYAYALLKGGYSEVDACFVRVEEERAPEGLRSNAPEAFGGSTGEYVAAQPVVVRYSYSLGDVSRLRDEILAAYGYSVT